MPAHSYPPFQGQPNCPFPIRETADYPIVNTIQASINPPPMLTPRFAAPHVVNQIHPYPVMVPRPFFGPHIPGLGIVPFSNIPILGYAPENILASSFNQQDVPNEAATINQTRTKDRIGHEGAHMDPLEFYLMLPKELFPMKKMLSFDPNPLIDEFCKLDHFNDHVSWILDLEFGVSRVPVTKDIPVKNIYCQNTTDAIHAGFESCSSSFKTAFHAYIDCIISAWYDHKDI